MLIKRVRSANFYREFAQSNICQTDAKVAAAVHDNLMNSLQPSNSHIRNLWVDDFSTLLQQRGIIADNDILGKLGRDVSQRHVEVYGYKNEAKTWKFVNGSNRQVAAYSIDKKRFVEECVDTFLQQRQNQSAKRQMLVPKLKLTKK